MKKITLLFFLSFSLCQASQQKTPPSLQEQIVKYLITTQETYHIPPELELPTPIITQLKTAATNKAIQLKKENTLNPITATKLLNQNMSTSTKKLLKKQNISLSITFYDLAKIRICQQITIGLWSNLKKLACQYVGLTSIEGLQTIEKSESLEYLLLDYNYLTDLPDTFFEHFPAMKKLTLRENKFSEKTKEKIKTMALQHNCTLQL